MMRALLRIGAAAVALVAVAACTGKAPTTSTSSSDATFAYLNNLDVMTEWDPATSYSNEGIAMANMYEQLTRTDPTTGDVEPLLAESWESSDGGLQWTFELRPDVTFTTGNPVDAAAAKAAIERTIDLKGGASYIWGPVKSITVEDNLTLVFDLKYATPLDLVASSGFGAYIYDTRAATGDLGAWFNDGHAAGTGPYVPTSWKKGSETELTLEQNDDYWGGWDGDHYTSVVYKVVPEQTTAVQLLESGEGSFIPQVSSTLFESLQDTDGVTAVEGPSFQNLLALFNTASGPLADPSVRQAVALAIDYDGIVAALGGSMVKATGVVPPGLLGYTEDVQQTTDPDAARTLLRDAGYSESNRLELTVTYAAGTPELDTTVTVMKANLASVGVDLTTKALAWPTQWDLAKSADESKRQDIFIMYWYPDYADPFSWFVNIYRSADPPYFNLAYWDDKQVDEVIDGLQAATATDREAAQEQYVELQQTISEQSVSPILGVTTFQRAIASSVTGYVDNPAYGNVVFVHDLAPAAD